MTFEDAKAVFAALLREGVVRPQDHADAVSIREAFGLPEEGGR